MRKKELDLQQMQRVGEKLPKSDRRKQKYLMQIKKRKGYLAFLKARYKSHDHKDLVKKIEKMEEG